MDGFASAGAGPVTGPHLDNRRVIAALIDLALLIPVALLMSMLFDGFTPEAQLLTAGWALYYYFALESSRGQTLGKQLMKIRVARADGGPLDMGRVAVRTLLRPIDAIGAYLLGLVVMIATGQRRQRLGDLAAGTVVTDADAPVAQPTAAVALPEARVHETEPQPVERDPTVDVSELAVDEPEFPVDEPELPAADAAFPVVDAGAPELPSHDEPPVPYEPAPHDFAAGEPVSHEPSPVDVGEPLTDPSPDEPPVPEVRPFEPFVAPEVDSEPEPAVDELRDPVAEEQPEPAPEQEPAQEPEPAVEEEPVELASPKLEIVSSPIDLVMEESEDGEDDPEPSSGPVPA
jgi:uncharacterized RDD family membrane protein YckC